MSIGLSALTALLCLATAFQMYRFYKRSGQRVAFFFSIACAAAAVLLLLLLAASFLLIGGID